MSSIGDLLIDSWHILVDYFRSISTDFLLGILLIVAGWLVSKIIAYLLEKLLILVGFNRWSSKSGVQKAMELAGYNRTLVSVIGEVIYWIIFILFFVAATEALGWRTITDQIDEFLAYIPALLSGILIFIVGLLLSNLFRNILRTVLVSSGVHAARIISRFSYYFLLVMISITALDQVGINTRFISNNLFIILASLLLAFGIAFAIASRHILQNILSSSYNKHNFSEGQRIRIGDDEGEIIKITNISVIIKTSGAVRIIPARKFIDEAVDVVG